VTKWQLREDRWRLCRRRLGRARGIHRSIPVVPRSHRADDDAWDPGHGWDHLQLARCMRLRWKRVAVHPLQSRNCGGRWRLCRRRRRLASVPSSLPTGRVDRWRLCRRRRRLASVPSSLPMNDTWNRLDTRQNRHVGSGTSRSYSGTRRGDAEQHTRHAQCTQDTRSAHKTRAVHTRHAQCIQDTRSGLANKTRAVV
jgi:hypothetical protein